MPDQKSSVSFPRKPFRYMHINIIPDPIRYIYFTQDIRYETIDNFTICNIMKSHQDNLSQYMFQV